MEETFLRGGNLGRLLEGGGLGAGLSLCDYLAHLTGERRTPTPQLAQTCGFTRMSGNGLTYHPCSYGNLYQASYFFLQLQE
jgi:hypothetical protein